MYRNLVNLSQAPADAFAVSAIDVLNLGRQIFDARLVAIQLETGPRDFLPFDGADAVLRLDLHQLCLELSYLVFVILGLPPEVQSTEDKEVLVLTDFIAKDRACK